MAFFKNKKKTDEKRTAVAEGRAATMQNPKILEVNLIKDEAQVSFDWTKNLIMFGLVLVIGAILVGEIYYGLDNWEEEETASLEGIIAETDRLNADISKLRNEAADALSYQDKALVFNELLDNHVYWSPLLSWIEKNTLSSVNYSGFSGDLSGSYNLSATASTFSDISWQSSIFLNSPEVKKVKIRQANSLITEDQVEGEVAEGEEPQAVLEKVMFDLEIELKPEIFKK